MRTQQAIEGKLEKKKRTLFGAAPGKKIAIFVDDINMPATETYGAQPPIELLRLFIDMKGLYDRDEWMWKDVEDTTIVAASVKNTVTTGWIGHAGRPPVGFCRGFASGKMEKM
jgi:dynein heavy chain